MGLARQVRALHASLSGCVLAVAATGCGRSALPLASGGPAATDGGVVDASQADTGSEPRADAAAVADAEADTPDVQEPAADCGSADGLTTLASGQIRLGGLAIDQANIYWLVNASTDGQPNTVRVMKESLCGGPITTLATVPGNDSWSIATDSHRVYWAAQSVAVNGTEVIPNQLFSVPVEGGAVSTLWSDPDAYLQSLAVASTGIYGTTWSGESGGDGALVLVPLASGAGGTLAAGQNEPEGLTIAGTMVYWVDDYQYQTPGALMAMPIGGGTPVTFGQGGTDPGAVVANSTNVFWTTGGPPAPNEPPVSAVVTEPLAGGATTTLLGPAVAPLEYGPLAADDANVYVATALPSPGGLFKVDVTGAKPPVTLASPNAGGLAIDSTSVYWTDWYAGTVMKLTSK